MFRVECFVDDRKLAEVLHRLSGVAMNVQAVPVVNAAKKKGTLVASTEGSGASLLIDVMVKRKLTKFGTAELNEVAEQIGRAKGGLVSAAKRAGWLTAKGNPSNRVYQITTSGLKSHRGGEGGE